MTKPKAQSKAAIALAAVAPAAFREGESRANVIVAVRLAIGSSKSEERFAAVRRNYMVGRMAARLNPGSNATPTERIAQANIAFAAAGADGTAKLRKGQSRRTPEQQAAYNAAKQAWSSLIKEAAIKSLDKRGGGSAAHKNKRGATGKRVKKAANNNTRQTAPAFTSPAKIAAFLDQQASMLGAFMNKNVKHMTLPERSAIEGFQTAIKAAHAKSE